MFVDDAVRGTLPGVCSKDGVPTTDRSVVRQELGDRAGLGVAWLLLLAGPLGWLGLLLISASRESRREVLTVEIPLSDQAHGRLQAARRTQRLALGVAVLGGLFTFLVLIPSNLGDLEGRGLALLAGIAVVGALATLVVADAQIKARSVQVDLDASRRWVTLSRVHDAFAAACRAQEDQQVQRA